MPDKDTLLSVLLGSIGQGATSYGENYGPYQDAVTKGKAAVEKRKRDEALADQERQLKFQERNDNQNKDIADYDLRVRKQDFDEQKAKADHEFRMAQVASKAKTKAKDDAEKAKPTRADQMREGSDVANAETARVKQDLLSLFEKIDNDQVTDKNRDVSKMGAAQMAAELPRFEPEEGSVGRGSNLLSLFQQAAHKADTLGSYAGAPSMDFSGGNRPEIDKRYSRQFAPQMRPGSVLPQDRIEGAPLLNNGWIRPQPGQMEAPPPSKDYREMAKAILSQQDLLDVTK